MKIKRKTVKYAEGGSTSTSGSTGDSFDYTSTIASMLPTILQAITDKDKTTDDASKGAAIGTGVGTTIGSIIAPGVGTMIGGQVGKAAGQYIGGLKDKDDRKQLELDQASEYYNELSTSRGMLPNVDIGVPRYFRKGGRIYAAGGKVKADYEVEKKEIVVGDAKLESAKKITEDIQEVKGATHKNGGVKGTGGDFVFSNQLTIDSAVKDILDNQGIKIKDKATYATAAKAVGMKLAKFENDKDDKDFATTNTRRLMSGRFRQVLGSLAAAQELEKGITPEVAEEFAKGGKLPKKDSPTLKSKTIDFGARPDIPVKTLSEMPSPGSITYDNPSLLRQIEEAFKKLTTPSTQSEAEKLVQPSGTFEDVIDQYKQEGVNRYQTSNAMNAAVTAGNLVNISQIPDYPELQKTTPYLPRFNRSGFSNAYKNINSQSASARLSARNYSPTTAAIINDSAMNTMADIGSKENQAMQNYENIVAEILNTSQQQNNALENNMRLGRQGVRMQKAALRNNAGASFVEGLNYNEAQRSIEETDMLALQGMSYANKGRSGMLDRLGDYLINNK